MGPRTVGDSGGRSFRRSAAFHVWDGMEVHEISVRTDGAPVETVVLSGGVPTEDGNSSILSNFIVILPQGTAEVEIQISEGGYAKIDTIIISGAISDVVHGAQRHYDIWNHVSPAPHTVGWMAPTPTA